MFFILLFSIASSQTPTAPQWPPMWTMNFTETTTSIPYGVNTVSGTWYYDASLNYSRIDRSSGRYDTFCGGNDWFMFFDTPCTHLVNGGYRYLIYPSLQICCMCCTSANGCGILSPSWLGNANFVGQSNYTNGTPAYLWEKSGNNPNYYWETVSANPLSREMLELDNNGLSDRMVFGPNRTLEYPISIFNLPSYCSSSNLCDSTSVCSQIRAGNTEHLKHLEAY